MAFHELRRFDLNLLVVFETMMVERNVSRAAARLLLGQPAVSHALARLREALGDSLFVRSGGAMQPTPRALELAGPVAEILADVRRRVLTRPRFDPATDGTVVRVGVSDYAEIAIMRAVIQAVRREAPSIRIVLQQTALDDFGSVLEAGLLDLVVGDLPEQSVHLQRETLFEDGFACVFDAQACGVQPPLGLADYAGLPHLLLSPRGELEGFVDHLLQEAGQERFVFAVTPHLLSVPWLLRGTRAVATVPRRFAAQCAVLTELATSEMPIGEHRYSISMAWHPRTEQAAAQIWLRGLVRRTSRAAPEHAFMGREPTSR